MGNEKAARCGSLFCYGDVKNAAIRSAKAV